MWWQGGSGTAALQKGPLAAPCSSVPQEASAHTSHKTKLSLLAPSVEGGAARSQLCACRVSTLDAPGRGSTGAATLASAWLTSRADNTHVQLHQQYR